MHSAKARFNKHNLSNLYREAEFSFSFICLYKLSFYVGVCCTKLYLCSYLRHSLIGFNKKSDGQLAGQEVEGGTSWSEKGTLGRRHERTHVTVVATWLDGTRLLC